MKVKVRKINSKKFLHMQYILSEEDINIFKSARKKYKDIIKAIRQVI